MWHSSMLAGDQGPIKDQQRSFHQAAVGHAPYADVQKALARLYWASVSFLWVYVIWLGFGVGPGLNAQWRAGRRLGSLDCSLHVNCKQQHYQRRFLRPHNSIQGCPWKSRKLVFLYLPV
jgi:hypothetical protein